MFHIRCPTTHDILRHLYSSTHPLYELLKRPDSVTYTEASVVLHHRGSSRPIVSDCKHLTTADGRGKSTAHTYTRSRRARIASSTSKIFAGWMNKWKEIERKKFFIAVSPSGGIPSRFCDCYSCCVGGKFTEFVLLVPGVWLGNDTGTVLPVLGTAGDYPTGP